MANTGERNTYVLGSGAALPPSTKRIDLGEWLWASLVLGLLSAWLALWLVWRPLPLLPEPAGSLGFHGGAWLRCLLHWLWPPAFGGEAKAYARFLAALPDGPRGALTWRVGLALWAGCAPAVFLARSCLAPRDGLTIVRGGRRHEGAEAVRHLNRLLALRVKARPDHPMAPGVPYSADMWTRHVLVVGGVGSGKSTALKPLIAAVIESGESMLLFDPKGEFTKGFAQPGIIAPWDSRSLSWDIARDMRNTGDMRRFAASMVREAHDPMWSNAARQILVGFMIYLKSTRGTHWGWRELAELMAIPQRHILPMMLQYHPEAVRSVERASVTTQGILINLSSFSAPIFDLAAAWGETPEDRRVSFVEWAQGGAQVGGHEVGQGGEPGGRPAGAQGGRQGSGCHRQPSHRQPNHRQLILQGHGAYPELTRGYIEGIIGTVAAIVDSVEMDDDENRKLWIIADEAAKMGKAPIWPLLDVGRSRGVRCVLACQDLAQLEAVHGQHMVKAMVSMAGTVLVGQMMQGDTAEQMCRALGTQEVERANISFSSAGAGGSGGSRTLSFAREEIAIYKPSELASRLGPTADGKGVRLALLTSGHAYELFWPRFNMRRARPAHRPADWTLGVKPMADVPAFDADFAERDDFVERPPPGAHDPRGHGQGAGRGGTGLPLGAEIGHGGGGAGAGAGAGAGHGADADGDSAGAGDQHGAAIEAREPINDETDARRGMAEAVAGDPLPSIAAIEAMLRLAQDARMDASADQGDGKRS